MGRGKAKGSGRGGGRMEDPEEGGADTAREAKERRKREAAAVAEAAESGAAIADVDAGDMGHRPPPRSGLSGAVGSTGGGGGGGTAAEGTDVDEDARRLRSEAVERASARAFPPRGLTNLGNTCFFNSTLQNIVRLPPFTSAFVASSDGGGMVGSALKRLILQMTAPADPGTSTSGGGGRRGKQRRGGRDCVRPAELLNEVCRQAPRFKGGAQQDAQELLRYMLDAVHEEQAKALRRKRKAQLLREAEANEQVGAAGGAGGKGRDGGRVAVAGAAGSVRASEPAARAGQEPSGGSPGAGGSDTEGAAVDSTDVAIELPPLALDRKSVSYYLGEGASERGDIVVVTPREDVEPTAPADDVVDKQARASLRAAVERQLAAAPSVGRTAVEAAFGGRLVSVIVCHSCGNPSIRLDECFDVSLQIPGTSLLIGGESLDPSYFRSSYQAHGGRRGRGKRGKKGRRAQIDDWEVGGGQGGKGHNKSHKAPSQRGAPKATYTRLTKKQRQALARRNREEAQLRQLSAALGHKLPGKGGKSSGTKGKRVDDANSSLNGALPGFDRSALPALVPAVKRPNMKDWNKRQMASWLQDRGSKDFLADNGVDGPVKQVAKKNKAELEELVHMWVAESAARHEASVQARNDYMRSQMAKSKTYRAKAMLNFTEELVGGYLKTAKRRIIATRSLADDARRARTAAKCEGEPATPEQAVEARTCKHGDATVTGPGEAEATDVADVPQREVHSGEQAIADPEGESARTEHDSSANASSDVQPAAGAAVASSAEASTEKHAVVAQTGNSAAGAALSTANAVHDGEFWSQPRRLGGFEFPPRLSDDIAATKSLKGCFASFTAPETLKVASGDGWNCLACSKAATAAAAAAPAGADDGAPAEGRGTAAAKDNPESISQCDCVPGADASTAELQTQDRTDELEGKVGEAASAAPSPRGSQSDDASGDDSDSDQGDSGGDDEWDGLRVVKRDASKRILFATLPRVLTCHLKRFAQTTRGRFHKLDAHVSFPLELDMAPFVVSRQRGDGAIDRVRETLYRLSGVVVHSGGMSGGHYVAYVRDITDDWFLISDTSVSHATEAQVLRCQAYLLFYERQAASATPAGEARGGAGGAEETKEGQSSDR